MFDIWWSGFTVLLILGGIVMLAMLWVSLLEYETVVATRIFATGLIIVPTGAALWPLTLAVGGVCLVGWALFTTARVIRHRSVYF